MFVIDQYIELWEIINNGPKTPMKKDSSSNDVPKSKYKLNQSNFKAVSKNYIEPWINNVVLMNKIQYEFSCVNAKEIWDKLVMIYEGTIQVMEIKINNLDALMWNVQNEAQKKIQMEYLLIYFDDELFGFLW